MTSTQNRTGRTAERGTRGPARYTSFVLIGILGFLFVANIFDPLGSLGLKYLAFLVAVLSSLWTLKYCDLSAMELSAGLMLFAVWPAWALLYGVVRGGDLSIAMTQVTPFLFAWFLAVLLPPLDSRLPLRVFYSCLLLLAVVVITAFALIIFLPENGLSQAVFGYLTSLEGKEGSFGTQSFDGVEVPWIYFSSTLFLVPAFIYYLFVDKLLRAGVVFLALGLTFSKAGITIALVFGVIYAVAVLVRRSDGDAPDGDQNRFRAKFRRIWPLAILGTVSIVLFLSLPSFSDQIEDAWAGKSDTALVRIGHFRSVTALFMEQPSILIVGQGAGIPFYSLGESNFVQSFEIDHLNAIRKFGVPWFIGYSCIVFYSAWKLIRRAGKEEKAFGSALLGGYIAAGTNPVLLTSLFVTLMILSYFAQRRGAELSTAGEETWREASTLRLRPSEGTGT